jgi:hypothetical protein
MSSIKLHRYAPPRPVDVDGGLQDMKRLLGRFAPRAASAADRSAIEARSVRELARDLRDSDPGFAADLYAAADRHELLHEARP